jgi:D-alanyl-D-alanine carboxypeptidase
MLDDCIQNLMAEMHIPGMSIAVVQAGEPVLIKSYGFANIEHSIPATERTVYEIASIGKTLTAMLTMMLVDDGCIALDDTIVDYLENPPEAWKSVSLKHILCHQSGIPSYTDAENYWNITRLDLSKAEVLALVTDLPLKFPPGKFTAYDNTGYYLLGLMIERVTRQSYAEALRDRILTPLGMTATGMNDPGEIVLHRAAGYRWEHTTQTLRNKPYYSPSVTYAAGGQLSTIADLVKWEQALQQGTLISQSGLEAMWQPQLSTHGNEWEHLRYAVALGWFVLNYEGRRVVGHNGSILGFASNITRFMDDHITAIVLCNLDNISRPDVIALEIARYFCPQLINVMLQPPRDNK